MQSDETSSALAEPEEAHEPPPTQPSSARDPLLMPVSVLLYVVAQVAAFDVFLYQGSGGLGYAILFGVSGLLILSGSARSLSKKLAFFVGLLAIVTAKSAWQSSALTPWIGFALLFALASCAEGNSTQLPELIRSCLASLRGVPRVAASGARLLGHFVRRSRFGRSSYLPIVVPACVTLLFLGVFGLANTVLSSWLDSAWTEIVAGLTSAYELLYAPGRFLVWVGFAVVAAVLALPKRVGPEHNGRLGSDHSLDVHGATASDVLSRTARNTLIGVNVLFFAYAAVDVVFLWVKNALPEGTGYSDYAREGVFWLTAALALTSLVLGIMFSGPLNSDRRAPQLKKLATVWVAQNVFLALLACQRIYIYFSFNGLTEMRIVGVFGIAVVVVGLLIVTLKIHRRRSLLWMVRWQVSSLALFGLALFTLPTGALVSRVNVYRILAAETLDEIAPAVIVSHHAPSPEGLPGLIPLLYLNNDHLPDSVNRVVREGVAGVLIRERGRLLRDKRRHPRWTYREFAIERALREIEVEEARLSELVSDSSSTERIRRFRELTQTWW